MKRYFFTIMLSGWAFLFTFSQANKISNSAFTGKWKGRESCAIVSAPAAAITITAEGNSQVTITGIYSSTGKIIATIIKGNTIIIAHQQIKDPVFVNFGLEGTLILSQNQKTLDGNITILNNSTKDVCEVSYQR